MEPEREQNILAGTDIEKIFHDESTIDDRYNELNIHFTRDHFSCFENPLIPNSHFEVENSLLLDFEDKQRDILVLDVINSKKNPHKNVTKNLGRKFTNCLKKAVKRLISPSKKEKELLIYPGSISYYLKYKAVNFERFSEINEFYKKNGFDKVVELFKKWVDKNVSLLNRKSFIKFLIQKTEEKALHQFFKKISVEIFRNFLKPETIDRYYNYIADQTTKRMTKLLVENKFRKAFENPYHLQNLKFDWDIKDNTAVSVQQALVLVDDGFRLT